MTITSSSSDPRSLKAIEIATGAGQWAKAYLPDGTKCYAVPSSEYGAFYLANLRACTCPDFAERRQPCKHLLAVRLHCERVRAGEGVVAAA
jgi:predicted nucleic acid-binding Zn finger protein